MRFIMSGGHVSILVMALLIAASGCRPAESDPVAELAPDSREQGRATQETLQPEDDVEQPPPTLVVQDTPSPTPEVPAGEPQATPTSPPVLQADDENESPRYRVVFVESDDVLNVRSGPGVGRNVVESALSGRVCRVR